MEMLAVISMCVIAKLKGLLATLQASRLLLRLSIYVSWVYHNMSSKCSYPVYEIIFNWMYVTNKLPVRDNVTARTTQKTFGIPRCSIVQACDN